MLRLVMIGGCLVWVGVVLICVEYVCGRPADWLCVVCLFFFNDTATTEIYTE